MAINYATKYNKQIDERYSVGSMTDSDAGTGYSWSGPNSKTIVIQSVDNMEMHDYKRTGTDRFGTVEDIGDKAQEMTCEKERSFTGTIDALDNSDEAIEKSAGSVLDRQMREVVKPEIDMYRIMRWCTQANIQVLQGQPMTKNTIGPAIIELHGKMSDALVPDDGLVLMIPVANYVLLKQNPDWLGIDSLGAQALKEGYIGTFDGLKVKKIPTRYFPKGVNFLIKAKNATLDPIKLALYRILTQVQGFSGPVVEGVTYYDSFVRASKADGVAVNAGAEFILNAPSISPSGPTHTVTCSGADEIWYTVDGSNPRYSKSAKVYSKPVALEAGQTIKAVGIAKDKCGIASEAHYAG